MQPKPDNEGTFLGHTSCDACGSSDANGVYERNDGTTNSYCFSCQTYQSGSPGDGRKEKAIPTRKQRNKKAYYRASQKQLPLED